MFKFDEICELVRLVGSTKVAGLEIEHAGSRIRIEGVAAPAAIAVTAPAALEHPVPHAVAGATGAAAAAPPPTEDDGLHYIDSPIVGTFYRAPNPDADPYVQVGDTVRSGQVLCIVEAMKLMNEIESDIAGTVVKVFAENAAPVEYGARLFAIRPA
jgi:acetyl-CoA carboxylase biotin carboxyl carrier protein